MTENWKDVPGYEGRYQVSDLGNVRSVDRRVRLVAHGKETTRHSPGCVLRPGTAQSGHLTVALGKGNSQWVHRLVMLAFVGPCPEGCEVLHLDHRPTNNTLANLKYGTRGENVAMDYVVGVRKVHPNFIGARWRT